MSEPRGTAVAEEVGAAGAVGARLHVVGGASLDVLQGARVAQRRLEAAYESGEAYAAFTQPPRGPIFVNPLQVKFLLHAGEDEARREPGAANARIHFLDGSSIDVVQGSGVANKRLSEARAALSLFATFTDPSGNHVFVNCATVTHLAPDLGAPTEQAAPEPRKTRTRKT